MIEGLEVAEMRWDLLVNAQTKRLVPMNSVWIREEGKGEIRGNILGHSNSRKGS